MLLYAFLVSLPLSWHVLFVISDSLFFSFVPTILVGIVSGKIPLCFSYFLFINRAQIFYAQINY